MAHSETIGLSPKVIASVITGLVAWAALKFGISIDSKLEGIIQLAAMALAGYVAPPGDVIALDDERGHSLVELAAALAFLLVGVGVLFALVD